MKINWQVTQLHQSIDKLQDRFGAKGLCSIYGAGCIDNPKAMFVFMNPTSKNVSVYQSWQGLRAPWLGTKNAMNGTIILLKKFI
jgi:hypothetical protein